MWAEGEKKKALECLAPLNFYPTQADILAKRTESTGNWLFGDAKFQEWLTGTGKNNSLICTGIRKYSISFTPPKKGKAKRNPELVLRSIACHPGLQDLQRITISVL